jgi:hypothetical protein
MDARRTSKLIAKSEGQWLKDPSHYDLPGIDVGAGTWITINGVSILLQKGEGAKAAFKRVTGKDLDYRKDKIQLGKVEEPKPDPLVGKTSQEIVHDPKLYAEYLEQAERDKKNYEKFMERMGEGQEEGYDEHGNILPSRSQPKIVSYEPTEENMHRQLSYLHPLERQRLDHFLSYNEKNELTPSSWGDKKTVSKQTIEHVLKLIKENSY